LFVVTEKIGLSDETSAPLAIGRPLAASSLSIPSTFWTIAISVVSGVGSSDQVCRQYAAPI
jgi:hypothetical protein